MLAGFLGALKDAMGQAPGRAGTVEAPIAAYPNFEDMEAESPLDKMGFEAFVNDGD